MISVVFLLERRLQAETHEPSLFLSDFNVDINAIRHAVVVKRNH